MCITFAASVGRHALQFNRWQQQNVRERVTSNIEMVSDAVAARKTHGLDFAAHCWVLPTLLCEDSDVRRAFDILSTCDNPPPSFEVNLCLFLPTFFLDYFDLVLLFPSSPLFFTYFDWCN